jgi:hypothetical protein
MIIIISERAITINDSNTTIQTPKSKKKTQNISKTHLSELHPAKLLLARQLITLELGHLGLPVGLVGAGALKPLLKFNRSARQEWIHSISQSINFSEWVRV